MPVLPVPMQPRTTAAPPSAGRAGARTPPLVALSLLGLAALYGLLGPVAERFFGVPTAAPSSA